MRPAGPAVQQSIGQWNEETLRWVLIWQIEECAGVSLSAVSVVNLGGLLLFVREEVSGALGSGADRGPIGQLLGAALIGLGETNWCLRLRAWRHLRQARCRAWCLAGTDRTS